MLQVSPVSIPFEHCPNAHVWPMGHCWHGKHPPRNLGVCCNCGKEQLMPWSFAAEQQHGPFHPHKQQSSESDAT